MGDSSKVIKTILCYVLLCGSSVLLCQFSPLRPFAVRDAKWEWISKKIFFEEPQSLDYVLIGSSVIWNAVQSKMIEQSIPGAKVWNFGRNWQGRDSDFVIIDNLLSHHSVRELVIELPVREITTPHEYAKYVISPRDVWEELLYDAHITTLTEVLTYSLPFKQRLGALVDFVGDLSTRHFRQWAMKAWDWHIGRTLCQEDRCRLNDDTDGFFYDDANLKQEPKFIAEFKDVVTAPPRRTMEEQFAHSTRADYYLRRIGRVAAAHGTLVRFIYLPTYNAILPSPDAVTFLTQIGKVSIPLLDNLYRIDFWFNYSHMFHEGSRTYTQELIKLLQGEPEPYASYYETLASRPMAAQDH